jgi:NTE family protein
MKVLNIKKLILLCCITCLAIKPLVAKSNISLEQLQDSTLSVGLALSGGAAKGLAHIGVIQALEESGIQIDYIAGTSMGALVGAAYASGMPIDTLAKIALDNNWKATFKFLKPGLSSSGLNNGNSVKDILYKLYGDKKIENFPIPFSATASDLYTGKLYIIDSGSLLEAVRASISIPVVFSPVKYKDTYLVDGGLVNPLPIDVVRAMGADYIIAVNIRNGNLETTTSEFIKMEVQSTPESGLLKTAGQWISKHINNNNNTITDTLNQDSLCAVNNELSPNLVNVSGNSIHIVQDVIAQLQIDVYKPDIVIEPDTRNIELYEFYQGENAIKVGYEAAKKILNRKK